MKARRAVAVLLACACACGQASAPPSPEHGALGGDVARVGDVGIPEELVARVAAARGIAPEAALEALVDDALASQGARARGLDRRPDVAWATVAATARLVAKRLHDDVRAAGPPTDAEVEKLTAAHWKDYALPEQVRVIHAVVVAPPHDKAPVDPAVAARGRAVAAEIARRVTTAASADDFEAAAKAVPSDGFDVRVERLPPFVRDGRVSEPGIEDHFDETFVAAAFALKEGGTSPVVETPFGWHVIRLLQRLPPKEVPLEERRTALAEETYAMRARTAHDALLAALRGRTRVERSPAEAAILAQASLAEHGAPLPSTSPAP